jgi:hypothetical protein
MRARSLERARSTSTLRSTVGRVADAALGVELGAGDHPDDAEHAEREDEYARSGRAEEDPPRGDGDHDADGDGDAADDHDRGGRDVMQLGVDLAREYRCSEHCEESRGDRREAAEQGEGGAQGGGRGASIARVGGGRGIRRARVERTQIQHRQVAVGDDRVTAAIARVVTGGEVLEVADDDLGMRGRDGGDDVVALRVGVGRDLMGDLQREEREAHRAVVGAGGEPVDAEAAGQLPPVGAAPEAHVMTPAGAAVDLLLVGEVLLASEEQERTHGCLEIAAAQHRGAHDAQARAYREVVGASPARRDHRLVELGLAAQQGEVDGVAEEPVARARAADEVVGHVDAGQDAVQPRQHQVRHDDPECDGEQQLPPSEREALPQQHPGQPRRGDTAEDEEDPVSSRLGLQGGGRCRCH